MALRKQQAKSRYSLAVKLRREVKVKIWPASYQAAKEFEQQLGEIRSSLRKRSQVEEHKLYHFLQRFGH